MGFLKFLLGTFVLGLATMLINKEFQEREVELKEMEQLGKFVEHALTEDVGLRLRFAQYFSNVTRSEELKAGWTRYTALVQSEYDEKQKEAEDLKVELAKADTIAPARRVELETKLSRIETELAVPKISRREMISSLLRQDRIDAALEIDPDNSYALSKRLEGLVRSGDYRGAIALFPKLKSSNDSGVGYTAYPFAIYAYLKLGEGTVARTLFAELLQAANTDIAQGYGYLSRAPQIRRVQDNFRDLISEAGDAGHKQLLERFVRDLEGVMEAG